MNATAEKISREQSAAYMRGWTSAYRLICAGETVDPHTSSSQLPAALAWSRGYNDCRRGAIDAEWALGPDLARPKT